MQEREIGWGFFENIIRKSLEYGQEWAEAKAESLFLEESKKPVFSDLMNSIAREKASLGEKITEGALERLAYAHQDYKNHIRAMAEAKKKEATLWIKYQSCLNGFEAARSCASLEKKKINMA